MLAATPAVAGGDFEFSSDKRRNDEIGDLTAAFADMSRKLGMSTAELRNSNERLSVEVSERKQPEDQVRASLQEKEVLFRAVHHRVKNNLQVIISLLNLQSMHVNDRQAQQSLRDSQNRVASMALVHQKFYDSPDLLGVDFAYYSRSLVSALFSSYRENSRAIALNINGDHIPLDINLAIPCGLIINELVSNSPKHAFSFKADGELKIELQSANDTEVTLTVSDNGEGFPEDLDFRDSGTLGLQLVNTLTTQLKGTIELDRSEGAAFKVTFPVPKGKYTNPRY